MDLVFVGKNDLIVFNQDSTKWFIAMFHCQH